MITDRNSRALDESAALMEIVKALDRRFPAHNEPGDRLGRLLEELAELAEMLLIEPEVRAENFTEQATKEIQDILRSIGGVARHYGIPLVLPSNDCSVRSHNEAFPLFVELVKSSGDIAKIVHRFQGMGIKRDKYTDTTLSDLTQTVNEATRRTIAIAELFGLRSAVTDSIQLFYRNYKENGFISDGTPTNKISS